MNGFHSRETLAGYERAVLERAVVTIVGAGMIANNVAQTLALSGVRELRIIDFDVIEPSNVTRSPLFRRELATSEKPRSKARELALAALSLSYASDPCVRFASSRLEEVGIGALLGSDVVIAAVDNHPARVRIADWTRLVGIPLVECGVSGHSGHISVFPNCNPDEPCWRCAYPTADAGSFSCRKYAQAVEADGRIPATQALGAVFGAGLVAEHAILALHGEFPLAGCFLELDLRSGRSNRLTVRRDPDCPGAHRRLTPARALAVRSRDPLEAIFGALGGELATPRIVLPAPYVVEAPCARCGATVRVGKPDWAVDAPSCKTCATTPVFGGRGLLMRAEIAAGDPEAERACRVFGLSAGAIFEVEDERTDAIVVCQLAGGVDELFVTRRRADAKSSAAGGGSSE
jgi:adenylyltransferase/sulfurtransferase